MPRSLVRPGMAAAEIREVALERRVMLAWRADPDRETVAAIRDASSPTTGLAAPDKDDRLGAVRIFRTASVSLADDYSTRYARGPEDHEPRLKQKKRRQAEEGEEADARR